MNVSRCVSFYCLNSILKLPWLSKTIETHHSERQSNPFKKFQMLCAQQEENSLWFSHSFISHIVYLMSSCRVWKLFHQMHFYEIIQDIIIIIIIMYLSQFISVHKICAKSHSVWAGCNGSQSSPFKTTYLYQICTHARTHKHKHTRSGSL